MKERNWNKVKNDFMLKYELGLVFGTLAEKRERFKQHLLENYEKSDLQQFMFDVYPDISNNDVKRMTQEDMADMLGDELGLARPAERELQRLLR